MKWLRFPRTLGIVVCLYLVGMSVVFGLLSSQNYRFIHSARTVPGTVIALVARAPIGSTRDPQLDARMVSRAPTVRYVVNGATYEYTAAHGRYRQPLRVGETVTVLYDPDDPAVARIRGEGRVLDQHHLPLLLVLVGEARVDDLVGRAGLADVALGCIEVLGAEEIADQERGGDERDPAEDRRLPVAGAPAAHPAG